MLTRRDFLKTVVVGGTGLAAMGLAGCSSSSSSSESSSSSSEESASSSETSGAEETTQTEEAVQEHVTEGGVTIDPSLSEADVESAQRSVINYGVDQDCTDFDPFTFNSGQQMLYVLYEPLAWMVDGEPVGVLMKDYSFTDDGLIMYGEIYDYITDSDGNEITASDVLFSYDMSNEYASLGMSGVVESFEVTGDYTFEVHFFEKLGIGKLDKLLKFFIVSEKAYEEHDMHSDPVGTGHYTMTDHVSGYSATMQKREDYWQTDESAMNVRNAAHVDTINYYVITETTQMTIALQNGTIDASGSVSSEDLDYFRESEDFWLSSIPDDLSMIVVPNCDSSRITSDVNLRRAVFYAISSEAILQSVWGGEGTTQHSLAPAWAVGYNSAWDEEDNFYNYDVDKAKEYLEQSSYNGESLVILCDSSTVAVNTATVLLSMLEAVGINAEISSLDGTIVKTSYADVNAWDLYIQSTATNTYWIDSINGTFTTDKTTWDGSPTFWYEQDLQDMLVEYMQTENATEENFNILHDYVIDNALGYGLVNFTTYTVLPSWCTGMLLSFKKTAQLNGCTYSEE